MGRKRHNLTIWNNAITDKKSRLRLSPSWFPFPAFIAIGLAIVLVGHIFFGLNPRLGNPSEVIYFDADTLPDNGIWISATVLGENIVVTTANRKVIKIPVELTSFAPIDKLVDHFHREMKRVAIGAGLGNRHLPWRGMVVIAADQRLKYGHMRPILRAIAKAGISEYGFETKMQLKDL